mmetsp:Transcript_28739/g.82607  ORF Transcript_28739/g.82607 Transcript_28739/m.82607 type:complete len:259 (-) Transcript_28739:1215-1991(-)
MEPACAPRCRPRRLRTATARPRVSAAAPSDPATANLAVMNRGWASMVLLSAPLCRTFCCRASEAVPRDAAHHALDVPQPSQAALERPQALDATKEQVPQRSAGSEAAAQQNSSRGPAAPPPERASSSPRPGSCSSHTTPNVKGGLPWSESCTCPSATMHSQGSRSWVFTELGWPSAQSSLETRVPSSQRQPRGPPAQRPPSQTVLCGQECCMRPMARASLTTVCNACHSPDVFGMASCLLEPQAPRASLGPATKPTNW